MEIEQREKTPECQRALFSAPTIMTETLQIQLLHIAQRWTFDMESGKYCLYSVITLEWRVEQWIHLERIREEKKRTSC